MPSKPPTVSMTIRRPGNGRQRKATGWSCTKTRQQRGYGAEHDRIRAQLLAEEPLCRECARHGMTVAATIADHIVSKSQGGMTVRSNYQPLCKPCSDAKTARERAASRGRG